MKFLMPKSNRKDKHPKHDKHKGKPEKLEKEKKLKKIKEEIDYYIVDVDPNLPEVQEMLADGVLIQGPKADSMKPLAIDIPGGFLNYPSAYSSLQISNFWEAGHFGKGITIGVVGTGINKINELGNRVLNNLNYSPSTLTPEERWDRYTANGHETGVSSIIAGLSDKYNGIAFEANVVDLKIHDDKGNVDWTKVLQCYDDVAFGRIKDRDGNTVKINILNCSFGGFSTVEFANWLDNHRFMHMRNNGILVVASAGNNNEEFYKTIDGVPHKKTPCACEHVVSVSALDDTGTKASFSNFDSSVDFAAQGMAVTAINRDGKLYLASGTSFATPVVSGLFALYMSRNEAPKTRTELDKLVDLVKNTSIPVDMTINQSIHDGKLGVIPQSDMTFIGHPVEGNYETKQLWEFREGISSQKWHSMRREPWFISVVSDEFYVNHDESLSLWYSKDGFQGVLRYSGYIEDVPPPYPTEPPVSYDDETYTYGTVITCYEGDVRKPVSMIDEIIETDTHNFVHGPLKTNRTIKYNPKANLANYGTITETMVVKNLTKGTEFTAIPNQVYSAQMIPNDQYEFVHGFATSNGLYKEFTTPFTYKNASFDEVTNLIASNVDTKSLKLTWDASIQKPLPTTKSASDTSSCNVTTTWEWVETGKTPSDKKVVTQTKTVDAQQKWMAYGGTWNKDGSPTPPSTMDGMSYVSGSYNEEISAAPPSYWAKDYTVAYTPSTGKASYRGEVEYGLQPIYGWGALSSNNHSHSSTISFNDGLYSGTLSLTGCSGAASSPSFNGSYVGQQTTTTGYTTSYYSGTVTLTGTPPAPQTVVYNVYKNGAFLTNTTQTSLNVTGLSDGTLYTFAVEAVYTASKKSPLVNINVVTNAIPVILPAPPPPPPPPVEGPAPIVSGIYFSQSRPGRPLVMTIVGGNGDIEENDNPLGTEYQIFIDGSLHSDWDMEWQGIDTGKLLMDSFTVLVKSRFNGANGQDFTVAYTYGG